MENIIERSFCETYKIPIISIDTEKFIQSWISKYKPHRIAEIGSAIGYSTQVLAQCMNNYTHYGIIDSREISYPHYRQSVRNMRNFHGTTVYLSNICNIHYNRYTYKPYDLIFIDGRKSETLLYLQKIKSYVKKDTTIIVDDAIKFKEKMHDWYQFLDNNHIQYEIHKLDTDDGIITIQVGQQFLQALSSL